MPVSAVVVDLGDVGLRRGATVIVESTSCPGTTQEQPAAIYAVPQNGSSRTPDRSLRCTLRQVDLFTGTSRAAGVRRFSQPYQSTVSK
jgi:hypothetical protein